MTNTKKKTKKSKDQVKQNHRQEFKGHRTKRHFLDSVEEQEAEQDIRDTEKDAS